MDSLSPKVTPARSVVYVVENHGRDSDDGMRIISIHSTKIAACRVKGRELRMQLAESPPELCTQRTNYKDWSVKNINWWYSEFDDICIREVEVDLYPYWPL